MKAIRFRITPVCRQRLTPVYRFVVLVLICGSVWVGVMPSAAAAPQVLPVSASTVSVAATDYFEFAPGTAEDAGTTWTLTAPTGNFSTITYVSQLAECTGPRVRIYFGEQYPDELSGCPAPGFFGLLTVAWFQADVGILGEPADGTWTIELKSRTPTGYESSYNGFPPSDYTPGVTLYIAGKAINFGAGDPTDENHQLWNWRSTAANSTWAEPSTTAPASSTDPINEGPQEDPNNAVFFQPGPGAACPEQDLQATPSGPPVATDNDGDDLPGYYTTPTQNRHVNPDCSITTTPGTPINTTGPDPDDNDPDNPGATCTESDTYTPSGDPPTPIDADGDGVPGSYTYTEDRRHVNADCSITTTNDARTQTVDGPDPDDNDPLNLQAPFTVHTLGYTTPTNCNNFANSTVSGAWLNGQGTLSSQFIFRDGNFLGTTDLRTIPLYANTTEENEGTVSNGTDSKSISYNNAVGTSYQFRVRNSTTEALGTVQWIPNGLCATIPQFNTAADVEHDPGALSVSASQAQCSGDPITWNLVMQDNPSGLQEHLVELFIFDANQGGFNLPPDPVEVAYYNTTTMHRTGPASEAHAHFVADGLPTGNYVAFAFANYTGIGAVDYIDAWAFNVPRGPCTDTPTDLSPVLLAVSSSTTLLNNSIGASRADIVAFITSMWSDYNVTEATNLAIVLEAIAEHDANNTAQHAFMNASLNQIFSAVQALNLTIDCGGSGNNSTCNFFLDSDSLLENITALLAENMTAFETVTGLAAPEMALLPGLALLGVIFWLRSTDYVVRMVGAMLPILGGLLWLAVGFYVGFGNVWAGTVPAAIMLMVLGIYLVVRMNWELYKEGSPV